MSAMIRDPRGVYHYPPRTPAKCHPWRKAIRDGRCRNCIAAAMPAEDPLPAQIANTPQRAGPVIPPECPKCRAAWGTSGDYVSCWRCGSTWHRTSTKVLGRPKETDEVRRALRALEGSPLKGALKSARAWSSKV